MEEENRTMNTSSCVRDVLEAIEIELAAAGCFATESGRREIAEVLDWLDRVQTPEQALAAQAEIARRLSERPEGLDSGWVFRAPSWLAAAECA